MRSRGQLLALTVALLSASGCSWLFQDRLPSNWNGNSAPSCSDSKGLAVLDGLFFASDVVAAVAASSSDGIVSASDRQGFVISSAIEGVLFGISALSGSHWADECSDARQRWGGNSTDGGERAQREAREFEGRHRAELALQAAEKQRAETAPAVPVAPPRGFFCAASRDMPAAGSCARDKADCQRTRDAAIIGVPDLGECALQETAWCVGEQCTPSEAACEARRNRAGSDAPACHDAK